MSATSNPANVTQLRPSLSAIKGVHCGAIAAGIKAKPGAKDLAFLYVPEASACAGVFTQNSFTAACVSHSKARVAAGGIKAIIVNAGNANAATGTLGVENCQRTAELAAQHLGISAEEVAVASTGIIGRQLPMDKMSSGLEALLSNAAQCDDVAFAEAIMTTDLVPKHTLVTAQIEGQSVQVAGVAKGSGMIAPNMATMLSFLVSDVEIEQGLLQRLFSTAVQRSFNMLSVDTDTSTNDMVLLLTNGSSGVSLRSEAQLAAFEQLLTEACIELAKQIARDGEGASKLLEVVVKHARTEQEAQRVARSVVNSPLVKTAVHGADPNWGRVVMAVGKEPGAVVEASRLAVSFQGLQVFQQGEPLAFSREELRHLLSQETVRIEVDLGLGDGEATAWGCDLTKGYIDINVEYN